MTRPFADYPLFSTENICRAFMECRRRKRGTVNAMIFEQHLEERIMYLHEHLTAGTYRPGAYTAFIVKRPKKREIFAADFQDRVVHHILVNHLEPKWERRFIHDSYACRKGKGTHKGVERLRDFTRKATANGTRPAWYLQLDVRSFFNTIDRNILYERLAAKENDPAVLWLLNLLIFNDSTRNCRMKGCTRSDFDKLPAHKTLFKSPDGLGLPIGNLTSQFFANVFLDGLDQFIKHSLKVKFYVRYCDDLVLVSAQLDELEAAGKKIAAFLENQLRLRLNRRRKLRPVSDGIDFLGYIVRPGYLLPRRRVVGALKDRVKTAEKELIRLGMTRYPDERTAFPWPWPLIDTLHRQLESYLGHFRRASSHGVVRNIRNRFPWLNEYFVWETDFRISVSCPIPRRVLNFSRQLDYFRLFLPGHILIVQLGDFWKITLPHGVGSLTEARTLGSKSRDHPTIKIPGAGKFHKSATEALRQKMLQYDPPSAWIGETGRRLCRISERALVFRISGVRNKECKNYFLHAPVQGAPSNGKNRFA